MVFTHFWDIWGHLGALKQSYLVKLQYHQKRLFKKKNSLTITQTTRCKFWLVSQFSNYHRYVTVLGKLRNQSKVAPGSLRNCQKIGVIFFRIRWQWRWRWRWKNFHWEMLRKFSGQLPTYIGVPEKILGTIPNVKFFTADPYFGVVFSTGLRKSAQNSTFLCF